MDEKEDLLWQGVIEMIEEQKAYYIKYGFDKEDPETFEKMESNLAKFKKLQSEDLAPSKGE